MAGRQIKGQAGRRERLLTPHDLAGIVTAQQGFVTGPIDYNSLINKPVIPSHLTDLDTTVSGTQLNSLKTKVDGIQAGAQVNVQSDWNAVSGDAFILHKPTIPAAQVNSDWNAVSGVAQILNKPTLATVATSGSYNDLSSKPTALPPNGPAGGSLTGTYPNPGVVVPVNSVFGRTGAVVPAANDYSYSQINGLIIPQGYIDGLQMVWNSATSISVTSGTAYIPSLVNVLASNSTLTLSGLSLAASTWYHVYLYNNAGTAAIEYSTTAPASPYNGTARAKTGDTSRRYVGSVLTDASGNLYKFSMSGARCNFLVAPNTAPFRVLAGGTATTSTNVDCSTVIPVTATHFWGRLLDASGGGITTYMCNPDMGAVSSTIFFVAIGPANIAWIDFPVSANLQFNYLSAPSAGSLYVDIGGFIFER